MNHEIEKKFVKDYILKNRRERIYYELGSKKKRKGAIGRFCHNAVDYIEECNIKFQGTNLEMGTDVINLHKEKECYLISWDDSVDGKTFKPYDVLNIINSIGMSSIVVFSDFCIIKTEQEIGPPEIIILTCDQV